MTDHNEYDGQELSLSEGFEQSGATFEQAWIEYLTMGGTCSREQIYAALHRNGALDNYEHSKLAAALNEFFVDAGHDHPVGTRDAELPD